MHLERADGRLISGYGVGVIGIDGREYRTNLLLAHGRVMERWYEGDVAGLETTHFAPLLDGPDSELPEICLLGTGAAHRFPPPTLVAALHARGIALEAMNTRAACRTYSVLVGEGRAVAAALFQIAPGSNR